MRKYSRAATQALQDRRLVLLQGTELSAIASPYLEKGVVKEWEIKQAWYYPPNK